MLRGSTGAKVDRAPEDECALIKQVQKRLFKHLDPVQIVKIALIELSNRLTYLLMYHIDSTNSRLPLSVSQENERKGRRNCHPTQLGRGSDLSCCLQQAVIKHTFHLHCGRGIQDDLSLSLLELLTYSLYLFLSTNLSSKQPAREFMGVRFILVL